MQKVIIFGHKGEVGSVLFQAAKETSDVEVTTFDIPELSLENINQVKESVIGSDIVIYAADAKRDGVNENWRGEHLYAENYLYELNVLTSIVEDDISKLIFCSSVHADNFLDYEGDELLNVPGSHKPKSIYGAHKIIFEEYVRFYAHHYKFQAVGLRLGGVTRDNSVRNSGREPQVWLSHNDLKKLIQKIIDKEVWKYDFELIYAVSKNEGRLHDTSNSFDWEPQDNSANFI